MNLVRLGIIGGLLFTFIVTIAVYPVMPDEVASHWNAAGELNGTMSKFWGLFLIPFIMAGFVALLTVLPRIDPLKKNYDKFRGYHDGFILVFAIYLLVIQVQILLWSLGVEISPNLTFPILFGLLFIYLGVLIGHAGQNWFVGIRTPGHSAVNPSGKRLICLVENCSKLQDLSVSWDYCSRIMRYGSSWSPLYWYPVIPSYTHTRSTRKRCRPPPDSVK